MLSVKQAASSTIFGMTRPGIESRSPGPLANILPTCQMSRKYPWFNGYMLDSDILVNEFDLLLIYYDHFRYESLLCVPRPPPPAN